jgi:hypothetical protein
MQICTLTKQCYDLLYFLHPLNSLESQHNNEQAFADTFCIASAKVKLKYQNKYRIFTWVEELHLREIILTYQA